MREKIEKLESVIEKLGANNKAFALDLVRFWRSKGRLSEKQAPWVEKLIERAESPAPAPVAGVEIGAMAGVVKLFATAKAKLRWPKIVMSCLGRPIILSVAGPASKTPGSINVAGEGAYPNREWYGRVSTEGEWVPSRSTSPEMLEALKKLLSAFAADPAGVARKYGALTGNCCFCNKKLTDERSTAAGFGPVCAENYGLVSEWKLAASSGALAPAA